MSGSGQRPKDRDGADDPTIGGGGALPAPASGGSPLAIDDAVGGEVGGPPAASTRPSRRVRLGGPGWIGLLCLIGTFLACTLSLPWTLGDGGGGEIAEPRYVQGQTEANRLPPSWWSESDAALSRAVASVPDAAIERIAADTGLTPPEVRSAREGPAWEALQDELPSFVLGSDSLGRSVAVRLAVGGAVSLSIGIAAALLSVGIGTLYGAIAAYAGGKVDSVMMRVVDVLYGLPYILLVILLAVAGDAVKEEWVTRQGARQAWVETQLAQVALKRDVTVSVAADMPPLADGPVALIARDLGQPWSLDEASAGTVRGALEGLSLGVHPSRRFTEAQEQMFNVVVLLVAIGGVSWLTMARVVRGQVLSLKSQPFMEAARAIGARPTRAFLRHLLPNLMGPITVYALLTVPQAILQESFLSFLGIGVEPPLPSWGNMAAEGLVELNRYQSHWWLLVFPSLMLAITLLSLNFVGEALREAFDPRRRTR